MTRHDTLERTILVLVALGCIFTTPGATVDLANWQAVTSVVVGLVLLAFVSYASGYIDGHRRHV